MICSFWRVTPIQLDKIIHDVKTDSISQSEENVCHLGDTWCGLNYLFCGENQNEFPQGFLLGGNPIGEIDNTDELPFRYFNVEETKAIACFLASFDRDKLHSRFDPQKMDGENCANFSEEEEEGFEWLFEAFSAIQSFFHDVANDGDCVTTLIS